MPDEWKWFVLDLNPEPWAIGPVSTGRKGSKIYAAVGRNTQLYDYQQAIKEELGPHHELIVGKVELKFFFWRNQAEYKTPQSRAHRKHEADVTNMVKATEDALQGILFKNDKDTNDVRGVLVEQGPEVKGRIIFAVRQGHDLPGAVTEIPDHVWQLWNDVESDPNDWSVG
jgi:Holliday junction resolvase RusA-like endonuclease